MVPWRIIATTAFRAAADVLHPPVCHVCDEPITRQSDQLCDTCWRDFSEIVGDACCSTCGESRGPHLLVDDICGACRLKRRDHVRFDGFAAVGRYDEPLRSLILRFKQHFVLDELLGRLLASRLAAAAFASDVDLWVPVPSHWMRRLRRGFQPSRLLARSALRERRESPCDALQLRRWVPEFHRHHLSRKARSEAIAGAFALRNGADVKGMRVCLIDDVMTTGTTLKEAARVLRKAGASAVFVAVLAKTHGDSSSLADRESAVVRESGG